MTRSREIAAALRGLDDPNEAIFYTSGRTSNEAAFLYQLLVRGFGTNNLPDCSNMCHESSGSALTETIGIGKGTVSIGDIHEADLLIVAGQNPGTNHPRMLSALEKAKSRGATIIAVNPLPEAGLVRFENPQTVKGVILGGTKLADQFVQIRLGGDQALFQAIGKHLLEYEDVAGRRSLDHEFIDAHTSGFEAYRAAMAAVPWRELVAATGLPEKTLRRVGEAVRRLEGDDRVLGDGAHAAQALRRDPARHRERAAAAGQHRAAGRRSVPGARPLQRAGRPHDGHLREAVRGVPRRARPRVRLHRAARARPRHRRRDPRDARRHGARVHGHGRQLRLGHPRHRRDRGGAAQHRPHRAGLDEAQPLARRHGPARHHPADPRPHRPRPPRRRRAAGHRRGLDGRGARLARSARRRRRRTC